MELSFIDICIWCAHHFKLFRGLKCTAVPIRSEKFFKPVNINFALEALQTKFFQTLCDDRALHLDMSFDDLSVHSRLKLYEKSWTLEIMNFGVYFLTNFQNQFG